ncbi:MAG: hypothetical protein QXJ96_00650 [Candidatus Aenigmatarchaeota archaeon]|nr:hypothetical protein [Candidatus Aenigmarchaeota archaeon]
MKKQYQSIGISSLYLGFGEYEKVIKELYEELNKNQKSDEPFSIRFIDLLDEKIRTDPNIKKLFPDSSIFY